MHQVKLLKLKGSNMEQFKHGTDVLMSFDEFSSLPPIITKDKSANEGYVLGSFVVPERNDDNVESRHWLAYDIDNCPKPIYDAVKESLEIANIELCIFTTYSHNPEASNHRVRVIINLAESVSNKSDFQETYDAGIRSIPLLQYLFDKGYLDKAMRSYSQFIFAPSYPPEREKYFRRDKIGGRPFKPISRNQEASNNPSSSTASLSINLPDNPNGGEGRNVTLTKACGTLINQHGDIDVVGVKLKRLNHELYPNNPLPENEVNTIIESISRKHERSHPEKPSLHQSVASAIAVPAEPASESIYKPQKMGLYLHEEPPPRKWIIEDFIPQGIVAGIVASGGTGKGFFTLDMCRALATGSPFLNRFAISRNRKVVYITAEDDRAEVGRRLYYIMKSYSDEDKEEFDKNFHIIDLVGKAQSFVLKDSHGNLIITPAVEDLIKQLLEEIGDDIGAIIVDPISKFRDADENDNNAGTKFIGTMERLKAPFNECSVILLHHFNKGGEKDSGNQNAVRGASSIVDGLRQVLSLVKVDHTRQLSNYGSDSIKDGKMVELKWVKGNYTQEFSPIVLKKGEEGVLTPTTESTFEHLTPMMLLHIYEDAKLTKTGFRDLYGGKDKKFGLPQREVTRQLETMEGNGLLVIRNNQPMELTKKGEQIMYMDRGVQE